MSLNNHQSGQEIEKPNAKNVLEILGGKEKIAKFRHLLKEAFNEAGGKEDLHANKFTDDMVKEVIKYSKFSQLDSATKELFRKHVHDKIVSFGGYSKVGWKRVEQEKKKQKKEEERQDFRYSDHDEEIEDETVEEFISSVENGTFYSD